MTDHDTRDRLIALERDVVHLTKAVSEMTVKVSQMHEILQQAKGVRWILAIMAALGGALATKLAWMIPGMPR